MYSANSNPRACRNLLRQFIQAYDLFHTEVTTLNLAALWNGWRLQAQHSSIAKFCGSSNSMFHRDRKKMRMRESHCDTFLCV